MTIATPSKKYSPEARAETRPDYEPRNVRVIAPDVQVHAARYSPCGRFLVAGGLSGEIRRWEVSGEEPSELPVVQGHNGWVEAVTAGPGERIYSGDSWGRLCGWTNLAADAPDKAWDIPQAHDGWIRQIALSPDGSQLASCGTDKTVRLWSSDSGKRVREFGDGRDLFAVCFHPNGRWLLTGDDRGCVKQWDVNSGDGIRQFDAGVLYLYHRIQDVGGVRALGMDREGGVLAVGGTTPKNGATVQGVPTVLLFDFESGELQQTLALGAAKDCFVHNVHLHEDKFLIAVTSGTPGSGQLLLQRYDAAEPFYKNTKIPNCHSLSLHPDGRHLAVTATNKGSNGNGRRLSKDGQYLGNTSPIHVLELVQELA